MWSVLALGAVEQLIHQWINLDAISRIQFNQLQGKMLRIVIDTPQLSVDVFFDENKIRLEPTITGHSETSSIFEQRPWELAEAIQHADATLHVLNVIELCKLFLAEDIGIIPLQGDYHLLQDIQKIIAQAEPDIAAQLSNWIGPNLASQIGKVQIAPKHLFRSLNSHLFFAEDFIKEDSGLFAARWEMDDLQSSTRALNNEIDRLDAKIKQLNLKFSAH